MAMEGPVDCFVPFQTAEEEVKLLLPPWKNIDAFASLAACIVDLVTYSD